jgi:hypothetical protein
MRPDRVLANHEKDFSQDAVATPSFACILQISFAGRGPCNDRHCNLAIDFLKRGVAGRDTDDRVLRSLPYGCGGW